MSSADIDTVIAGLYEAISAPRRMSMVFNRIGWHMKNIAEPTIRRELEGFQKRIEKAKTSSMKLKAIQRDLEDWQDKGFPTG